MPLTEGAARDREHALRAAVELHTAIDGDLALQVGVDRAVTIAQAEDEVRGTAEVLAAWLAGTTRIRLTRGPILNRTTGQPASTSNEGAVVQIHDDEKFTLTVDTRDARGFETSDAIDWSESSAGSVISLVVSDDGRSCTVLATAPGVGAMVTATDNTVVPPLTVTEAVDVVPGGTATITLTEGPVEKQ